jgi:hypothetical protein
MVVGRTVEYGSGVLTVYKSGSSINKVRIVTFCNVSFIFLYFFNYLNFI